ncbi:MAG: T9SS type A sorting domain-containing protein [Bacteroidetes bacterium]|nr:T9SS type A sorting domain-containing protein [Bacteroidota bacterium]
MVRVTLIVLLIVGVYSDVRSQILNGDFESWTNGRPDYWTPVDTMGSYMQGIDTSNNSACFSYHAAGSGTGAWYTDFLSNATRTAQFGSVIPPGSKVLMFRYTHNCDPTSGYISATYKLHLPSGNTYANSSLLLAAGGWQTIRFAIPPNPNPLAKAYAEINFRFIFASLSKTVSYSFDASIDDVGFDSVTDASTQTANTVDLQTPGIYPNPASSIVTIKLPSPLAPAATIFLSDAAGRICRRSDEFLSVDDRTLLLDVSSLPNGLYFIHSTGASNLSSAVLVSH